MKKIELLKVLEKYPLFTFNEFVRVTGKPPEYSRTYLHRLKKEGHIFQVEKGKYTVFGDPMVFSSYITVPSYISFWTAISFYNLTEQLPRDIMLASPKPKKTIWFDKRRIRFFKTKHMWGYKKQRYMDFDILVAEKEKCIIDSLLLKNLPFSEVVKALKTKDIDAGVLVEYAIKTKSKSLMKRLGYAMEICGMEDADGLAGYLDRNYVPLDWNGKSADGKNKKCGKWRVIINGRLNDIDQ